MATEFIEADYGLCPSCHRVLWAVTARGVPMPVDELPHEEGNLRLDRTDGRLLAQVVPAFEREATVATWGPLHRSHFATCRDADKYRTPR